MPGILSYLLSPKVAPLTLETLWHLTMRLLAAAKSGAEGIFCSLESQLDDSEGLYVEELGYIRRGDILAESVAWQRRVEGVSCPCLAH